jgi:hypothetical protein
MLAAGSFGAEIRGQYLEARTCDVYTGPCFANAEMTQAGKEALLAWKVEEGAWNGTSLSGLSVALVLKADGTLGDDGVFTENAGHVSSVILVDDRATDEQQQALVAFVKDSAAKYTADVKQVQQAPISLENDYYTMEGVLKAGNLAEIRTRKMARGDCVCSNEQIFYQPLTEVYQATPAYSLTQSYTGKALDRKWTQNNSRSAFLATFRK